MYVHASCTCFPSVHVSPFLCVLRGQTITRDKLWGHMVDTCVGYLLRDLPTLLEVTEAGTIYSHES